MSQKAPAFPPGVRSRRIRAGAFFSGLGGAGRRSLASGGEAPGTPDGDIQKGDLLRRLRSRPLTRHAVALLLTAAALGLTFLVRSLIPGITLQVPFFLCAIVGAAWFGGFMPGILASIVSLICIGSFFLLPGREVFSAAELFRLSMHFVAGAGISWLGGLQLRREEDLVRALERLEETVQERTLDLRTVNGKLSAEVSQRIQAQQNLLRLNRALRVRSVCNWSITRTSGERTLLKRICQGVVKAGEYRLAAVHCAEGAEELTECARHVEREEERTPPAWGAQEYERGLVLAAARTRRPQICHDLRGREPRTAWREWAEGHALRAVAVFPLHSGGGG